MKPIRDLVVVEPSACLLHGVAILDAVDRDRLRYCQSTNSHSVELCHGIWKGEQSELSRVDPRTGEVLEKLKMPLGVGMSGFESGGGDWQST
jgi:hypothetical protein